MAEQAYPLASHLPRPVPGEACFVWAGHLIPRRCWENDLVARYWLPSLAGLRQGTVGRVFRRGLRRRRFASIIGEVGA